MQECQFIEIYGTGLNYSLADSYRLCFEEIGIQANAYSSFNPMHIEYLKNRNRKDTLCILLTHTGQNEEMLKIAKQLDFANTNTVVICDNLNREICKYCDEAIVIMTTKNTIELSNSVYMTSLQYIFDILTSMHLISNYSHIEKTTKIVDEMKIQGDIK